MIAGSNQNVTLFSHYQGRILRAFGAPAMGVNKGVQKKKGKGEKEREKKQRGKGREKERRGQKKEEKIAR